MINVEIINDPKVLLQMKDDLNFFINKKIVAELYAEWGQDPIELYSDRELARELLEKVLRRLREIGANAPIKKKESNRRPMAPAKTGGAS